MSSKKNIFLQHKIISTISFLWIIIGLFTLYNVANENVTTMGVSSSGQLQFTEGALGYFYYWETFLLMFILPVALIWGFMLFWKKMRNSEPEKES